MEIEIGEHGHDQEHGHETAPGVDLHTLPVHIVDSSGAIRVHQAPYDIGSARTKTIGTSVTPIQPADRHRGRVQLLGQAPFYVSFTGEVDASQDAASQMAWWPANTCLEIRGRTAIYAAAVSGTCALSIITERTTETHVLGVD